MSFLVGLPKPVLPAAIVASTWMLLPSAASAGSTSDDVSQSIRAGLPAYDPNPPKPVAPAPPPEVATHVVKRISNPAAHVPNEVPKPVDPAAAEATVKPVVTHGLLQLPKMTINGPKAKQPSLPRIFVQPPAKKVDEPMDPNWETPAGRAARLVEKHITGFDKTLNSHPLPLIGTSLAAKAEAAEAREHSAKALNNIADILELSAQLGLDDPEEQKKLRAEYLNALADRPR